MTFILKPIVTEKALLDQERGCYHFSAPKSATKHQIRSAFVTAFGQTPVKINALTKTGKTKTDWRRRQTITKPSYKKVIITLPKGKKIDSLTLKQK